MQFVDIDIFSWQTLHVLG